MESLQEISIKKIVADYPTDILMHFHQAIEDRLRNELKYKIVIAIDPCVNGLIYDRQDSYFHKLFIKFILKLLNNMKIEMDDNIHYTIRDFRKYLKEVDRKSNLKGDMDDVISDLKEIKSYKQFLEYFLNKWEINPIFILFYNRYIADPIHRYFKYGFDIEESKQIIDIHRNFLTEYQLPDHIKFIITVDVNHYDYILCEKCDDEYEFITYIYQNIDDVEINERPESKIYQIK